QTSWSVHFTSSTAFARATLSAFSARRNPSTAATSDAVSFFADVQPTAPAKMRRENATGRHGGTEGFRVDATRKKRRTRVTTDAQTQSSSVFLRAPVPPCCILSSPLHTPNLRRKSPELNFAPHLAAHLLFSAVGLRDHSGGAPGGDELALL